MPRNRRKVVVTLVTVAVLVLGVAGGRRLLAGGPTSSPSSAASGPPVARTPAAHTDRPAPAIFGPAHSSSSPDVASSSTGPGNSTASGVPTGAVTPVVVHTATIDMRTGKGELDAVLQDVATLAATDGGYVDSSSVSGGTARRSPVSGTIVIRVLDSDFAAAVANVAHLGTVEDQRMSGQDVTIQSAQNAASIYVLEDEVSLLEAKLGQATDIGTFLPIQNQLFSVEKQLQQLQSAEAVLENSAALATLTVDLSAPGTPVVPTPRARPGADAATMAWRYLRHNTLAVLDALAVAGGWALPVLVPLGLVGVIAQRVVRARRRLITPA
jgi:hypothetical protein